MESEKAGENGYPVEPGGEGYFTPLLFYYKKAADNIPSAAIKHSLFFSTIHKRSKYHSNRNTENNAKTAGKPLHDCNSYVI